MDRRFFLSAAPLVTAAVIAPAAIAVIPSTEFERAFAAWRQARSAFDTALSDAEGSAAADRTDMAFLRLIHAPARNAGDIAVKLDAMLVEYEDCIWDEDRVKVIAADARRLAA